MPKGSKLQIQLLVEKSLPHEMNARNHQKITIKQWLFPIEENQYKEYTFMSKAFKTYIEKTFHKPLDVSLFGWPIKGKSPTLDGLAISSDDEILIFEAKSHPDESLSSSHSKSGVSIIKECFTKNGVDPQYTDHKYYQLANRIALKNFLLSQGFKVRIVYLCFINDTSHTNNKHITSRDRWEENFTQLAKNHPVLYQAMDVVLLNAL
ncbi:MAG: hypothetical protein C4543_09565 [Ignavibacteriales bacterium]|jgi:hypothetical protein|nr:MAG: hypothetical protein C4543_09565 [Ignavibacteriales bacterium]